MWQIGDRVRMQSPVHGEMVGTLLEISRRGGTTIYHVEWQTSKTGVIHSKELAGRDDRFWKPVDAPPPYRTGDQDKAGEYPAYADALRSDIRLASPHTRRAYQADLARFDAWRGDLPINASTVEAYLEALRSMGKSAATRNRALAAIRWQARQQASQALRQSDTTRSQQDAWRARLWELKEIRLAPSPSRPVPALETAQVDALLTACRRDPSLAGRRDEALLELATAGGLRRKDLAGLVETSLLDQGTEIVVRLEGARGRTRTISVHGEAAAALRTWLEARRQAGHDGPVSAPLFNPIRRGGHPQSGRLSGEALRLILKKRAAQAGLGWVTWQALRTLARN